jgi:hypothetical protein
MGIDGEFTLCKEEAYKISPIVFSEGVNTCSWGRTSQLTVFSFRIRLKRFTMMAGAAKGLALIREYVEGVGRLDED